MRFSMRAVIGIIWIAAQFALADQRQRLTARFRKAIAEPILFRGSSRRLLH